MKRRLNGIAAYEYWVLRALSDNGGSDKVRRVYEVVFENMRDPVRDARTGDRENGR
jgi:hypothetical protein